MKSKWNQVKSIEIKVKSCEIKWIKMKSILCLIVVACLVSGSMSLALSKKSLRASCPPKPPDQATHPTIIYIILDNLIRFLLMRIGNSSIYFMSSDLLRAPSSNNCWHNPEKPVNKFVYLHLDENWIKPDNIMRPNSPRMWYYY